MAERPGAVRRRPRLGQHFLVNGRVAEAMADAAVTRPGQAVLEIGPGRGALTRPLLARGAQVLAVEIDAALAQALSAATGSDRLSVLHRDATSLSWPETLDRLASGGGLPAVLAANLPYGAATAILLQYLACSAEDRRLGRAVVMVQAEVAERLAARPRCKAHGSLAVLAQCTHRVRRLFDVAPGSFRPPPRVWSTVVELAPLSEPLFPPADRDVHAAFLHEAFRHRRKQLASVLGEQAGRSRRAVDDLLRSLGHAPTVRAEELTPRQLIALSGALPAHVPGPCRPIPE